MMPPRPPSTIRPPPLSVTCLRLHPVCDSHAYTSGTRYLVLSPDDVRRPEVPGTSATIADESPHLRLSFLCAGMAYRSQGLFLSHGCLVFVIAAQSIMAAAPRLGTACGVHQHTPGHTPPSTCSHFLSLHAARDVPHRRAGLRVTPSGYPGVSGSRHASARALRVTSAHGQQDSCPVALPTVFVSQAMPGTRGRPGPASVVLWTTVLGHMRCSPGDCSGI